MEIRPAEVKSGAFILLAVLVFMVLIFAVGDLKSRFARRVEYHAYITDAKFLKVHDAVTFGGLRVGEIDRVDVPSNRFGLVKVYVTVAPGIEVREDSVLTLKQDGMLGPKYLEISPGSSGSPLAKPNSELKAVVIPAITDLSSALEKPLAKLDALLENLNKIVGSKENQQAITDILTEAKTLLEHVDQELRRVSDVAVKTADKAQGLMDEVQATIKENRPQLQSILKNVDEMSGKLNKTADNLDQLVRDADGLIIQNNANIYETIRALRDTAYHMEQASKRIRANPSVLLFGAKETPEERVRKDEAELRMKGRTRRFDKEDIK